MTWSSVIISNFEQIFFFSEGFTFFFSVMLKTMTSSHYWVHNDFGILHAGHNERL